MIGVSGLPRPFQLVGARSLAPVVLTCEHASNRIPGGVAGGADVRRLVRGHRARDLGAWRLAAAVARRLGATAVGGRWSRLWIDLNRRADDPEIACPAVDGVVLPWNAGLSPRALERRVAEYHAPYHGAIDAQIVRRLVRGVRPVVVAVHSFTPVYDGTARRFDVGVLYEHHRGPAQRLARRLRDGGFKVRYNEPYSGLAGMMYSADRHGSHHDLVCLEIEMNDALNSQPARFERLGSVLAAALR